MPLWIENKKYALDCDGTTYVTNNGLDVLSDFTMCLRVNNLQHSTLSQLFYFLNLDTYFSYCILRALSNGNIDFKYGYTVDGGSAFEDQILIPYTAGNNYTIVACYRNSKLVLSVNETLVENTEVVTMNRGSLIVDIPVIGFYNYNEQDGFNVINPPENGLLFCEVLQLNESLTNEQIAEFYTLDEFDKHSDFNTFDINGYYNFSKKNANDQAGSNNGIVTGTEQYTFISDNSYLQEGIQIDYERTFIQTPATTFEQELYEWYYGGNINVSFNVGGTSTVKLLGYFQEDKLWRVLQTESGVSEVDFTVASGAFRRLKVNIEAGANVSQMDIKITSLFDYLSDEESSSTNSINSDNDVFYSGSLQLQRNIQFKVPKIEQYLFESLLVGDCKLDLISYECTGLGRGEQDVNNLIYNASFLRLA